ncbi:MAG: hypothetical protein JO246_10680, partial [Frankiaceae bacterium]|nr:hypothetical protein [Frankiaceae bacterium]
MFTIRRARSRWIRTTSSAAALAIAVGGLSLATATQARADSTSVTGDESVSAPTAWVTYTGLTTSQISAKLGST